MKAGATRLVLVALAVLWTACAADAAPKDPPPTVPGVRSAPPPAWIETRAGDRWLAFFDYCWTSTCIDSRPVAQRTDVPRIRVVRGELVRFHLGFRPASLVLKVGAKSYRLQPARVASWRVAGPSGVLEVTGRVSGRRAAYVARLVVA